ncbi:hypothetical protein Vadar_009167 [Vaccinium darrowii]|uniref:Uncharacterized protein n=1 Tax=Vaccinium darrowii TaxID=229202 RepID=A0ACB7Z2P0_9ERIC|nr:hypothetical protein Vadar_009167 [Vaccinium darrowii]
MKNWDPILLLILLPLFSHFPCATEAYYADFPSANPSVSWKNSPSNEQGSVDFIDGSTLRPILLVYNITKSYPPFGLGFFTNRTYTSTPDSGFYLVVFLMTGLNVTAHNSDGQYQFSPYMPPKVLWSANRDSPVGENATLDFTAEGDLVLRDEFSNPAWTTNTSNDYVALMAINVTGNLMLLNGSNGVVWQSYDYPTDTWLPNQKIYNSQRLTARSSSSNLSTGIYFLSVKDDNTIRAFLDANPPEEYAILLDGNFSRMLGGPSFGYAYAAIELYTDFAVLKFNFKGSPTNFGFIVLEPSGHLTLYCVDTSYQYSFVVIPRSDLLAAITDPLGECSYPTVCRYYGVCSGDGQCACPEDNTGTSNYFLPFEQGVGCAEITPLSCEEGSRYHTFVDLPNVTYFDFVPTLLSTTIDECKEACLNNCSCKAALFRYGTNVSSGNCSLQSDELYSFMPSRGNFSSYASIKVQKVPSRKNLAYLAPILVPPPIIILLIIFVGGMYYRSRKLKDKDNAGEESDDQVTESLAKFSFEELKSCTQNFQIKLGEGGFGTVFEGVLHDDKARTLGWKTRQEIIYGVAKGLQYLHEECHKNIIHFDIKPQNILLDRDFNAKISDFGLARLIDRNKSLVLTSLKGTIGYLAPEMYWGSHISVKADIYSFGVVILETVCGRKNLDESHESMPLVDIVKTKAEEDKLYDLIDDRDEDIWHHKEEAIKMMKIAIWCLQTPDRRPSMSMVVKVLEGSKDMDLITDHHS